MANFQPGDRVRYFERRGWDNGDPMNAEWNGLTGSVTRVAPRSITVKWDDGKRRYGVYPENLALNARVFSEEKK